MSQSLVTATVAAQMLRVNPKTIRRMAEDGRLKPAGRLPGARGAYLFNVADIEARIAVERAQLEEAAQAGDGLGITVPATAAGASP